MIFFSFIAAIGLAENSSVVLVASMLVSPIMVLNFIKRHSLKCYFVSNLTIFTIH